MKNLCLKEKIITINNNNTNNNINNLMPLIKMQ